MIQISLLMGLLAISALAWAVKSGRRRLAEADYQIRITKAKALRDENKLIAEGVTPALLEFRRLEVLEALGNNQNTVFMPVEGMTNPGAQVRMFGK